MGFGDKINRPYVGKRAQNTGELKKQVRSIFDGKIDCMLFRYASLGTCRIRRRFILWPKEVNWPRCFWKLR